MTMPDVTYTDVLEVYPQYTSVDTDFITALIVHATELVQYSILNVYDDTDEDHTTAASQAIIHQTGMWLDVGDTADIAGYKTGSTIKVGELEWVVPQRLAPRALRSLKQQDLTTSWGA